MLGTKFSKNKKAQHGSVMLEVIAVLALMGVMGSMLFRQIYQRNQELHNIQMASEIRTVKEAFSAYIQAYRAVLLEECTLDRGNPVENLGTCNLTSDQLGEAIGDYLPAGWFVGDGPEAYYTFSLWTYQQADSSAKQVIFGIVAPKETTLPTTGWNFKRAARVALLVGADGGVYDNTITGSIAGSLGSWSLNTNARMGLESPTYVAMTGLDVFTPEYELPEGQVKLPKNWRLATEELGAWNYFSAGGTKADCYAIGHTGYDADGYINPDQITRISPTCSPLFYVQDDGTEKKVFVNNDLEIGSGTTTNLTLTQEGVIKQKDGLTIDADGRIITNKELKALANNGEILEDERYVLDPAYTSTMNDIRLASRGGVRLSDILPRYILKSTQNVECNITKETKTCTTSAITELTDCPTGYTPTYLITPTQYAVTATEGKPKTNSYVLKNSDSNLETTSITGVIDDDAGGLKKDNTISVIKADDVELEQIEANETFIQALSGNKLTVTVETDKKVKFAYENNIAHQQTMTARVDGYCVYNVASGSVKTNERYQTEQNCCEAGLTWQSSAKIGTETGRCVNIYPECNVINSGINSSGDCSARTITNKAAVCKAAGCNWNGTTCS